MTNAWLRSRVDPVQSKQIITWTLSILGPLCIRTITVMPQSQDIHLKDSKNHRGQTITTAGQDKHLDACMRLWQDMRAPTHASLAQEMHAPKPLLGACFTCMPHLKVYRPPNRTLISH